MTRLKVWEMLLIGVFHPSLLIFHSLLVGCIVQTEAEEPSLTSELEERQLFFFFHQFWIFFPRQTCFQLDKSDLVLAATSSQSIYDALVCIALYDEQFNSSFHLKRLSKAGQRGKKLIPATTVFRSPLLLFWKQMMEMMMRELRLLPQQLQLQRPQPQQQ